MSAAVMALAGTAVTAIAGLDASTITDGLEKRKVGVGFPSYTWTKDQRLR